MQNTRDASDGVCEHQAYAPHITLLTLDDLSSVRHVHASTYRTFSASMLSDGDINATIRYIYSQEYLDYLLSHDVYVARIENNVAGTLSLVPYRGDAKSARINEMLVHPLYQRMGVGGHLLEVCETDALKKGYCELLTRTISQAEGFMLMHGFHATSHGNIRLKSNVEIRVVYMRKTLSKAQVIAHGKDEIEHRPL